MSGGFILREGLSATYSTNFPLTENPISEGGKWLGGATNGIVFGDCRTTPARVFADRLINVELEDSLGLIKSSIANPGANQFAEAVIYVDPTYTPPSSHECELLLRGTFNSGGPLYGPLYEINFPWGSTDGQIIRQNGPINDFLVLTLTSHPGYTPLVTGDVIRAKIVGSDITAYVNGVSVMTATDTALIAGQPGIGFFVRQGTGATPEKYCFSSWNCGPAT